MNKFLEKEQKGRDIFENILKLSPFVKWYKFTDLKCHYDCEYETIDGHRVLVEIKFRDKYSSTDKFMVEEGVMLEKFKYDTFLSEQAQTARHIYVTLFNDGKGVVHCLDGITPKWYDKYLSKTTAVQSDKVLKIVANLALEDGRMFFY